MRPDWRHLLQPQVVEQILTLIGSGFVMLQESPPDEQVLRQHACELVELGYTPLQVRYAIRTLRQAPVPGHMRRRAPLSGDIHNLLSPSATVDDRADALMQTVMGCMPRYGYTDPDGAREKMGEVAWGVVARMGGWRELCGSTMEGCTSVKAQLKKSMTQALRADDDTQLRAQLAAHDARWQLDLAKQRSGNASMTNLSEVIEGLCHETRSAPPLS